VQDMPVQITMNKEAFSIIVGQNIFAIRCNYLDFVQLLFQAIFLHICGMFAGVFLNILRNLDWSLIQ